MSSIVASSILNSASWGDAGSNRFPLGFEIPLNLIAQPLLRAWREMVDGIVILHVILVVIDRRRIVGLSLDHFRNRLIVHVGCMFERIGPGANRVARAARPVGMNRDFLSERMRGIDGRLHR